VARRERRTVVNFILFFLKSLGCGLMFLGKKSLEVCKDCGEENLWEKLLDEAGADDFDDDEEELYLE